MQITKLSLRNFLSFGNESQELAFGSLATIVGPNDSGKTNIFRALTLLGELLRVRGLDLKPYFHRGDTDQQLEIRADVQFDESEIQALTDFLACSALINEPTALNPNESELVSKLKEELVKGTGRRIYEGIFTRTTLQVVGSWPLNQQLDVQIKITIDGHELFIDRPGVLHTRPSLAYAYSSTNLNHVLKEEMRASGVSLNSAETASILRFVIQILRQPGEWGISIPGFDSTYLEQRYGSRVDHRRLLSFLRSRMFEAQYIDLFSLVGLIFNSSLNRVADFRSPSEIDLDRASDSSRRLGLNHLDGPGLTSFLFQLKNSHSTKDRERLRSIIAHFRDLTQGADFEVVVQTQRVAQTTSAIVPTAQNASIAPTFSDPQSRVLTIRDTERLALRHSASILVTKNGVSVPIGLAAAGIFEQLVIATILGASSDSVILLDEPALNLHPTIQRRLVGMMRGSVSRGRNQVVMITHSPYLTDVSNLEHTWRIGRKQDSSTVHSVGKILGMLPSLERDRVLLKLGRPELRALLFSKGVVFVEGPSDKIVIEEADRYLSSKGIGADLEAEEWAVIYLDGKNSLGSFLDLATILKMEYAAVLDYDALMKCDNSINKAETKILTSSVLFALNRSGQLSKADFQRISVAQGSVVRVEGDQWYPSDHLSELSSIARSHHVFILERDLEGAIQTPKTIREKKPLRAMQRILELIDEDKVPEEIKEIDILLGKRIRETA